MVVLDDCNQLDLNISLQRNVEALEVSVSNKTSGIFSGGVHRDRGIE